MGADRIIRLPNDELDLRIEIDAITELYWVMAGRDAGSSWVASFLGISISLIVFTFASLIAYS